MHAKDVVVSDDNSFSAAGFILLTVRQPLLSRLRCARPSGSDVILDEGKKRAFDIAADPKGFVFLCK